MPWSLGRRGRLGSVERVWWHRADGRIPPLLSTEPKAVERRLLWVEVDLAARSSHLNQLIETPEPINNA